MNDRPNPIPEAGSISSAGLMRIAKAACVSVICLAVLVLVGWMRGIETWKRVFPGFVAMNPLTAVGFVLAGCALWLLIPEGPASGRARRGAGRLLAAGVLFIGAIKLGSILSLWQVPIDQWMFRASLDEPGTTWPNRMAPNTAFNFFLLGCALLLLDVTTKRGSRPSEGFAVASAAASILPALGYLYGVEAFYGARHFIPMALHTSIGFLVLIMGIVLARPRAGLAGTLASGTQGGLTARRLLPAAILIPVFISWARLAGERAGWFSSSQGVALVAVANMLVFGMFVWWCARRIHRTDLMRSAAAREVQDQRKELQDYVGSMSTLNAKIAPDGTIQLINKTWLDSALARLEEVQGKTFSEAPWFAFDSDVKSRVATAFEQASAGRRIHYDEKVAVAGEPTDVSFSLTPVLDQTGRVSYVVAELRDISALKETEAAARAAEKRAEQANLAKSVFLSRMSHELRTPLNAILGFGQLLEDGQLSEDDAYSVQQMMRAGRHLLDLINEVLDIAAIEAGRMPLSVEPVELGEVLSECVQLMTPAAKQRKINLVLQPESGRYVNADRQRLRQVILNLISNAVKYNREGGSIFVTTEEVAALRMRVNIQDTGYGIPEEFRERVFGEFERLGAERTEVEGTGLGLAVSKRLVQLMGGTIAVESALGMGSTFSITLPMIDAPLEMGLPLEPRPDLAQSETSGKQTILYVEDNLSNVRLIERVLARRPSVSLIVAMKGSLGLELAAEHQPDLIFLDLNLPDLSGRDVLLRLRAEPRTRATPIVILSADATPGQVERLRAAGADAYLTKPFPVKDLLRTLDDLLHAPRATPRLAASETHQREHEHSSGLSAES